MTPGWRVRVAAATLVLAAALTATVGVRAARLDPLPDPATLAERTLPEDADVHRRAATPPAAIEAAANNNPFHAERRRGGVFRMPGEGDDLDSNRETRERPQPRDEVRLVGTVVTGAGRDFVVCAVGREAPRVVRLGGRCGDWTVESVERRRAEFTNAAGDTVLVEVPKEGRR